MSVPARTARPGLIMRALEAGRSWKSFITGNSCLKPASL
ncbi:hypothetical protein [Achromobacter phage tuull]|nr:hypothetical protein [Achromobacter phage tuull]